MAEVFGLDWNTNRIQLCEDDITFVQENDENGKWLISQEASMHMPEEVGDYYKYLSVIFEFHISGKSLLVCESYEKPKYASCVGYKYSVSSFADVIEAFPKTILDKQARILMNYYHNNSEYGFENARRDNTIFFAKNDNEEMFIINMMKEKGLIDVRYSLTFGGPVFTSGITILERGWLHIEEYIKQSNLESKKVFVAMWFDKSLDSAFAKIYEIIERLGYIPLRIDTKEHNNEISGEILYEIRRSNFMIADVTGQRHGVYFEAGFALGSNIPVIWSCRRDFLDSIHFDTRQYNHIVWENVEDLAEKLEKRIKGTIFLGDIAEG